jgi:hypothetical protein
VENGLNTLGYLAHFRFASGGCEFDPAKQESSLNCDAQMACRGIEWALGLKKSAAVGQ